MHPSLHLIGSAGSANAATLVQVIAHGVDRTVGGRHTFMPPFRSSLDDAQIASLANFVRTRFGGVASDLGESEAAAILGGRTDTPWLIRNAAPLAVAAIIAVALVLLLISWRVARAWTGRRTAS